MTGKRRGRYGGDVNLAERYRSSDKRHPFRNDALFALLLFVLTALNATTTQIGPHGLPVTLLSIVCCSGTYAVRRRFPYIALLVATVFVIGLFLVTQDDGTAQTLVFWSTMYTVGTVGEVSRFTPNVLRAGERLRTWGRGLSVFAIILGAAGGIANGSFSDPKEKASIANTTITAVLVGVFIASAWFIGDLVRARRANEASLASQNAELVLQREANARRAVLDERVRISRELHDVVAHHVSLMGVQAGAARLAIRQRPEKAEAALAEVERSSRQAVAELHRLLRFLRQDELDSTAPQPTLADLDQLIGDVQRAGRDVTLVTSLPDDPLPASVQLTAFRIVQEALTNALKHSSMAPIDVSLKREVDGLRVVGLRVVVHDHGSPLRTPSKSPSRTSHGLTGIRERVAFHGGTLSIEPTTSGFVVDAALPLVPA